MQVKLPSFQFYVGDWQKDPNLRRASKAEKGVLIDMICLMYECEDRGILSTGGTPWSDSDVAGAIGGDISENLTCLSELLRKGVVSRNQSGAIFSRRIVRDEHKRKLCVEAGKLGGNPTLKGDPKGDAKGTPKGGSKRNPTPSSSVSSSTSISKKEIKPDELPKLRIFTDLWCKTFKEVFNAPYKFDGGRDALGATNLIKVDGYEPESLMDIAKKAWAITEERQGWYSKKQSRTVHGFSTYFNQIRSEVGELKTSSQPQDFSGWGQIK